MENAVNLITAVLGLVTVIIGFATVIIPLFKGGIPRQRREEESPTPSRPVERVGLTPDQAERVAALRKRGSWLLFGGLVATVFGALGILIMFICCGFAAQQFRSAWRIAKEAGAIDDARKLRHLYWFNAAIVAAGLVIAVVLFFLALQPSPTPPPYNPYPYDPYWYWPSY